MSAILESVQFCPDCGHLYDTGNHCVRDGQPLQSASVGSLLGQRVGNFVLTQRLGRGGMGEVYLGRQPEIGSKVAIKVLSAGAAADPDLVRRFFVEAKSVNKIEHRNIVKIMDMG
jgi:serine/threonine-protein kinase